jgi:hypothetical protein
VSESADSPAADPAPDTVSGPVPADAGEPPTAAQLPMSAPVAGPPPAGETPAWTPDADQTGPAAVVADRPEIGVSAAFAGGFVLALILKRLAR